MEEPNREAVRRRADGRCEYCLQPDSSSSLRFAIDHIIARQHGGSDEGRNLAWACPSCNRRKGPNIAGVDPQTGRVARLFDPRTDNWRDHFSFDRERIVGKTEVGRTTVTVLGLNLPHQLEKRKTLILEGLIRVDGN